MKTEYKLQVVITPKPLLCEVVGDVTYFKNPFTKKHFGYVDISIEKHPNGGTKFTYTHYATGERSTYGTYLQACDKAFRLWQEKIETKITKLATLTIEIK